MLEQFTEQLKQPELRVVGTKQVLRLAEQGELERVFIAEDADAHIIESVTEAAKIADVVLHTVPTKRELGEACGIKVAAACAAIVK